MEYLIAFAVVLVTFYVYTSWNQNKRLPPGPTNWPLVGNIFEFDIKDPKKYLTAWREKFGKIFSFSLMGQKVVVVSSPELVREALLTRQEEFSGRPVFFLFSAYSRFQEEVICGSATASWKLKKKALHTSLKMYGEELKKLERITLDCIQDTLATFAATRGQPFNPHDCLLELVLQVLAVLISGEALSDADLQTYGASHRLMEKKHNSRGPGKMLELFPWFCMSYFTLNSDFFRLRHFGHPVWKKVQENVAKQWEIYNQLITNRKQELDPENPECVLDGLILQQMKEYETLGKPINFTDEMLGALVFDVFDAGIVTTLVVLRSLIAILVNHPELQTRMQKEIDHVLGEAEPRLEDRDKLPYVNAVLYEQLRYVSGTPFMVPHLAMKQGELGGYTVPKGAQIWCDVFTINHDPEYWEDPWTFKPERFLDEQGQLVGVDHPKRRRINLCTFGAGRRSCIGEVLAKNRTFLIITSLFQKFLFHPTEGKMAPNHDPRFYKHGLDLHIQDYEIKAEARKPGRY